MATNIGQLMASLGLNTTSFDRNLQQATAKLKNTGQQMRQTGLQMSTFISAPLAAAGAGAVKFAADFESAIVEVQKVTDRTTADQLSQSIMEMARTIPLAQTELAGLAADAARFGIRGVKNIENFTRTVAKMAEATDLTSDVAGEALAKISSQTNTAVEDTENLGSAINELSNNFATSSSEIVDSMLRSSAAASNFGLQANEIAGVSAQMNAMSESAERAGTRLRRLFQELLNPKKVSEFANAIGMSAQEFQEMRKNSPRQALMALVRAMAEGGEKADNLRRITSTVSRQALTALSKNLDDTTRALNMSGQAFKDNTSLQREFEAATDTFNAKWKIMLNQLREAGIQIGKQLMPIALDLVKVIKDAVNWFSSLSSQGKRLVIALSGIAAAAGPALVVLGSLATVLGSISLPIVGVVAGLAALAAGIIYVADNWKAIKERISDWSWWRNMLVDMLQFFIENNPFGLVLKAQNALFDALGMQKKFNPFKAMADQLEGLKTKTKDYEHEFGSFTKAVSNMAGKAKDAILGMMPEGGASVLPGADDGEDAGKKTGKSFAEAFANQTAVSFTPELNKNNLGDIGVGINIDKLIGQNIQESIAEDAMAVSTEATQQAIQDVTNKYDQMGKKGKESIDQITGATQFLSSTFRGFQGVIEQSISTTQSFGKLFLDFIKQMITKLIAAAFAAFALALAITLITGGSNLSAAFKSIGKNMGGAIGGFGSLFSGGGIPGMAEGGTVKKGGRVIVGEEGPETLDLPKGAQVTPMNKGGGRISIQPQMLRVGEELYIAFKEMERKRENSF